MIESSIIPAPPPDQWFQYWDNLGSKSWEYLKAVYLNGHPVWLFAKGGTFNKDFDWDWALPQIKSIPFAVNHACMQIPVKCLMVTGDTTVFKQIPDKYREFSICGVTGHNWAKGQGSGNYALTILGALGVKDIITVGFDNCGSYGFDYPVVHKNVPYQNVETDQKAIQNSTEKIIDLYQFNITKHTELL